MPIGPNFEFDGASICTAPSCKRLELFLVLVERRVGVDLNLDLAVGVFLGEFLELLGALALRRIRRHHVTELDHDRRLRRCGDRSHENGGRSRREKPLAHRRIPPVSRSKPAFTLFFCRLGWH